MRKIGPSWPGYKNQKRCLCVLTDIRGQDCYLRTDALTVQPVCDVPTWFCPSLSFPPISQKCHGACTQISFHQTFKEASTLVDPCQFWVVINISNLITFLDALCYDIGQTYQILIFFYFSISKYDCDLGSVCHSHFFGLPHILFLTEQTDAYNRQFCTAKCWNPAPNISDDYFVLESVLELSCGSNTEVWKQKMKLKILQKSRRKRRMAAVKM